MLGAEGLLADGERALEQRLGLGVAAGVSVEQAQVVERGGEVGMLGAEGPLADGERAPVAAARPRRSGRCLGRAGPGC